MQLLTVAEVSDRLRISLSSAYDLIQRGALPCHRIGPRSGVIRVSTDDLETYLTACREEVVGRESLVTSTVHRRNCKRLRHLKL